MIVLLELLTALLEYIDLIVLYCINALLILQLSFFQQEFILSYKYLTYYRVSTQNRKVLRFVVSIDFHTDLPL